MKKIYYILTGGALTVALICIIAAKNNSGNDVQAQTVNPKDDSLHMRGTEVNLATAYAVKLPAQISFAGEKVPMEDFEVKERMDRELTINTYWHSNTIQSLKLAHRWFPMIEKELKDNGVPDDFKYLALAESGLRNVSSPSGAEGIWQFLPGTAQKYGLRINNDVDERYNIEKSTDAAIQYFKEAHAQFSNWTLAAASYDAGMGGIQGAVDFQKQNSYYDLYLKDETSRYIFRILAFKILYENTQQYGFMLGDDDLYQPWNCSTVKVDTTIHNLADFALAENTNYKMLKYYNPWLTNTSLTVKSGDSYDIKLPGNGNAEK